ncbi:MAG: hypothetical protein JWO38_5462 [Gemmataceae bacterium]|nr:hypothetical protein [Gemmataceae bacterium]
MHRRSSFIARLASVTGLVVLVGGCHSPAAEYQQALPRNPTPAAVNGYPPVSAGRQTLSAPGTLDPLVPASAASTPPVARGASPTTSDRPEFLEPFAIPVGPKPRPEDVLPPPASLEPDTWANVVRRPGPTVTAERSDSAGGVAAKSEPGPNWVAAIDTRLSKTVVPGSPPVRENDPGAAKLPASDDQVDAPKPAPPAPATPTPATGPTRAPTPARPMPPPTVTLVATTPAPPPRESRAAVTVPPPDLPRPLPATLSARGPTKDDGIVLVGGVAIPIPPDALAPGPVRPASASMPPTLPVPPVPLTIEPPIRPADSPRTLPPLTDLPTLPPVPPTAPVPGAKLPTTPAPLPAIPPPPPPTPAPNPLPAPLPIPGEPGPGPIDVGGAPLPFDSLSRLIDGGDHGSGGGCSSCGGSCGGGQCSAGHKPCEPFPARTSFGRVIGLVYENICCPNPCYQPRWESITAAAFFTDAPRPVTQTRFRWDYGSNLAYPDRGEMFWARADGSGKGRGPKPVPRAIGVPSLAYHELYLDQEIASGLGSVTISLPYRSVNPFPFAPSAAGFSDLQITAKSLLFDSELFMFAFQMRTYIPTGNATKGLGTGHTSLEPGLIAGIRVSPNTYAVAQVEEWIPLGGDSIYAGAALKYNFSFNHVLWRPVKDVQLIGTWEMTGLTFQDGAFTDPVLGTGQKLSGQTSLNMGVGGRLFFCDKFDAGAGWAHEIAGRFLPLNQLRVEFRYRY